MGVQVIPLKQENDNIISIYPGVVQIAKQLRLDVNQVYKIHLLLKFSKKGIR